MNERITAFYAVISDNEVICFETNLKLFVEKFSRIVPDTRNYDWFYRKFKKESYFSQSFNGGELYFFQKVI